MLLTEEQMYVQRELQNPRVQIDRKCWAKTPDEKIAAKEAKSLYKKLHGRTGKNTR